MCVAFGGRSLRILTASLGRTSSSSREAVVGAVDAEADECEEEEEDDDDDEDDEISLHLVVGLNELYGDVDRLSIV